MGTGTSRAAAVALLTLCLSGCGAASRERGSSPRGRAAFAWLHASAAPRTWHPIAIPNGAVLAYPRGWKRIHGDSGTATVTLSGPHGSVQAYLNLTPRQGGEALASWPRFRTEHNGEEGDRHVTMLASATGLRFRTGHGTCVQDSYVTSTGGRYVEIACLVAGRKASTVIVGAAPPKAWPERAAVIERVISSFTT